MSNALHSKVSILAASFASAIVAAIRSSSVEDLRSLAVEARADAPRRGPGRPRKTATAITAPQTAAPKAATKPASPAPKSARKAKERLARRSPAQIAKALENVVALVKSSKAPLRSEQIREKLGMDKKEMPRVLKEGLDKKILKSKGEKRSTAYSLA